MRVIVMEHWEDATPLQAQLDALCRLLHRNNVPDRCVQVRTNVAQAGLDDNVTVCYWAQVTLLVPRDFDTLPSTGEAGFPRDQLNATFDHVCDVQWPQLQRWVTRFTKVLAPFAGRHNNEVVRAELKAAMDKAFEQMTGERWKSA